MQVRCVACKAVLDVPDEKATDPHLQFRCGCGALTAAIASRVPAGTGGLSTARQRMPTTPAEAQGPRALHTTAGPHVTRAPALRTPMPEAGKAPQSEQVFTFRLAEPESTTPPRASRPDAADAPIFRLASAGDEPVPAVKPTRMLSSTDLSAGATTPSAVVSAKPQPARTRTPRPGSWRRCVTHPQAPAETMCPTCAVGYCRECKVMICPTCDGPCMPPSGYGHWLAQERLRARPMLAEVKTILAYPFQDPLAFVLFALVTGFFGFAAQFSPRAIVFSWGILLWYSFNALYQVASGNLKNFIPDFDDISDLTRPLRLSAAALLVTWGPLLLLAVLFTVNVGMGTNIGAILWGTPMAQEESRSDPSEAKGLLPVQVQELLEGGEENEAEEESPFASTAAEETAPSRTAVHVAEENPSSPAESSFGVWLLLLLALLWKVAYTPVALIVAALSKNVFSVLNPLIGLDTLRRMGPVYWHVMLIYTMLTATQWGAGKVLGLFPLVGGVGMSFVEAYMALAVGCALGLAVFKKAPALGWD